MAKHLHNIDRILNEAQDGFEEPPPPAAWDKIQAALDHEDVEKYRAHFVWWKRVAVAMTVLFCLFITREIVHTPTGTRNGVGKIIKPLPADAAQAFLPGRNKTVSRVYDSASIAGVNSLTNRQIVAGSGSVNSLVEKQYIGDNDSKYVPVKTNREGNVIKGEQLLYLQAAYGGIEPIKDYRAQHGRSVALLPADVRLQTLPQAATGENVDITKKQRAVNRRIQFAGVYLSADISQYMLDNDVPEDQRGNESERDEINHREKHEPSFTVGVFAEKPLALHTGIKAGLAYAKTAIVIAPQQLVAVKQNGLVGYKYITSSGYALVQPNGAAPAVGDSATTAEAQHRLDVVSVPLSVYYRFTRGRFAISPSAGLSANFITAARVQTELNNRGTKETVLINRLEGSRWFYAGAQLDADIRYRIAGNWHIGVTPSFRCAFTAITKNNAVKTFPYTIGVAGSLVYKF